MRRKIARVFGVTLLLLSFFFLWGSKEISVRAADIAENEKAEYEAETEYEETEAGDVRAYMEEKLEFDDINRELEGLFPDEKLDFGETVLQILSGDSLCFGGPFKKTVCRSAHLCVSGKSGKLNTHAFDCFDRSDLYKICRCIRFQADFRYQFLYFVHVDDRSLSECISECCRMDGRWNPAPR